MSRAATVLLLVLAMGFSGVFLRNAWGAEERDHQKEFGIGNEQATGYFMALYTAFGAHYRTKAILKECGHQAEADALNARLKDAAKSRIDAMVTADIDKRILRSPTAIFVAAEGATTMLVGYSLGYEEGLAMLIKGLPAWYRDALCDVGWKHREDEIPDTVDPRGPKSK
jgi:hypothetical protein